MNKKKQDTSIDVLQVNNELITNPIEIANNMNKFFVKAGITGQMITNNEVKPPESYVKVNVLDSFFLAHVTRDHVLQVIKSLPLKSSTDIDGLSTYIIKLIADAIIEPLTFIINLSFQTGIVPKRMKSAKVIPIYKNKGDPKNADNYRPISLLPTLSKIIEKIVYLQMTSYIDKHKLIYTKQYGFLKNSNTEMAIADLIDNVLHNKDENYYTLGIFLDIKKAFDSLSHVILLKKLNLNGFRGKINEWLASYLSERVQAIKIDELLSEQLEITAGVPQGSILGPLLFLLYINDIRNVSELTNPYLFADDSSILWKNKNLNNLFDIAKEDFKLYINWFIANKLALNFTKTDFLVWDWNSKSNTLIPDEIVIDGHIIKRSAEIKYLGVILDDKLNWEKQINNVANKIARALGIMYRINYYIPRKTVMMLYYSLIYPHLLYGILLWGNAKIKYLRLITKLQNRFLYIYTRLSWYSSISPYYKLTGLLKLGNIYKYMLGFFMYKFRNNFMDKYQDKFINFNIIHSYNTRNSDSYILPKINKEQTKNMISYKAPHYWNGLPGDLKSIQNNVTKFKKELRKALLT